MRLRLLASLALSLVAFVSATSAHAQLGGGRVLHIIVLFAAGGVQDILARSISNELGTALGQTVTSSRRGSDYWRRTGHRRPQPMQSMP